jgi:hypothetical protein
MGTFQLKGTKIPGGDSYDSFLMWWTGCQILQQMAPSTDEQVNFLPTNCQGETELEK